MFKENRTLKATLTVYPDTGTGGTTVDGYLGRNIIAGDTWAAIRDGAGTVANTGSSPEFHAQIKAYTSTDKWESIHRSIFTFDTSPIGSGGTVNSAVFSLKLNSKADPDSWGTAFNIFSASPSSDNALVFSDYGQLGTTGYSTAKAYADMTAGSYNDFTLNATGVAAINKSGITKLGGRESNYDATDTTPTWASGSNAYFYGYFADSTGTTSDPYLTVDYTEGSAFTPKTIMIITNA
jgi:hypothetical protein